MKNYEQAKAAVEVADIINLASGISVPADAEQSMNLLVAKLVALQETISKI